MTWATTTIIIVAAIILFSPLTWGLLYKQYKKIIRTWKPKNKDEDKVNVIQNINIALDNLVELNKGALIIIDDLNETVNYIADQEYINAEVSANLITSIFEATNSSLHDGAIIISENRIKSASAFISKLSNKRVPRSFGTRHRSALGISEVTKSIVVVLSEESKSIHIFYNGSYEKINKKDFFEKMYEYWK